MWGKNTKQNNSPQTLLLPHCFLHFVRGSAFFKISKWRHSCPVISLHILYQMYLALHSPGYHPLVLRCLYWAYRMEIKVCVSSVWAQPKYSDLSNGENGYYNRWILNYMNTLLLLVLVNKCKHTRAQGERWKETRNKQKEQHVYEMPIYLPDKSFRATNLTVKRQFVQYMGRSQIWSKLQHSSWVKSGTEDKNLPQNKRRSGSRRAALYGLEVVFLNSMTSARVAALKPSGESQEPQPSKPLLWPHHGAGRARPALPGPGQHRARGQSPRPRRERRQSLPGSRGADWAPAEPWSSPGRPSGCHGAPPAPPERSRDTPGLLPQPGLGSGPRDRGSPEGAGSVSALTDQLHSRIEHIAHSQLSERSCFVQREIRQMHSAYPKKQS